MADRSRDWMRQAEADLRHARNSRSLGDFEWACFAAHQAAEKAVKACFQKLHAEVWGHVVSLMLSRLSERVAVPQAVVERAKILDKHYIPARYPNGFEEGAPTDLYTSEEAENAITIAGEVIEFCKSVLAG
ncbi:MAG TPA: DNA-binding protein [Clostridiales bacterium]|nr:DNA-binding protein [Clostridiales bacterium]